MAMHPFSKCDAKRLRWGRLPYVSLCTALLAWGALGSLLSGCGGGGRDGKVVRVGTKNFTEQLILGSVMAQLIEARTDLRVDRRFNLGGTLICHTALVNGEIDLYPEYTGTALTAILGREVGAPPDSVYREVAAAYREQFECEWLGPFGFNNTYAIAVRGVDADEHGWKRVDDLREKAPGLTAGFTAEFSERPDGYPGLKGAYGFGFGTVRDLDPGLMYDAIVHRSVEVICAFATDGRIAAYHLALLDDNREFFPPYYAAPVVRRETLEAHPELRDALAPLAGTIPDSTMRKLNYRVDEHKLDPDQVAREFLVSLGLLGDE